MLDHLCKWQCTHGDILCASLQIITTLTMFLVYVFHSIQCMQIMKICEGNLLKNYLKNLSKVFITCGAVHLLTCVVSWFISVNYTIIIIMLMNILFSFKLIFSREKILSLKRERHDGTNVVQNKEVRMVLSNVDEESEEDLNEMLEELRQIIEKE